MRSLSNFGAVIFPWKVHCCSVFSPFVDDDSHRVLLPSES